MYPAEKSYLINWIGGKRLLRKAINPLIPENIGSYIEPFGGGGWILFGNKKWAELEVYNDLDSRLVNLFRVVKYHPEALIKEFRYMIFSRKLFYQEINADYYTDIQKAARFLYIISRSFGGKGQHFGIGLTGEGGGNKSHKAIVERIDIISNRLDRVTVENYTAFELIPKYDYSNAFFYCDPPYSCGAGYETTSCKDFKHEELRDLLKGIKGRFLLSYDDAPMIRELYKDFNIISVERTKGINNKNIIDNVYKEVIVCNYDITYQQHVDLWYCSDNLKQNKQRSLFS